MFFFLLCLFLPSDNIYFSCFCFKGPTGFAGRDGPEGALGGQGPRGLPGSKGDKGVVGIAGLRGEGGEVVSNQDQRSGFFFKQIGVGFVADVYTALW